MEHAPNITTTQVRGHKAPYLLRVLQAEGRQTLSPDPTPADPPVPLAPGATRTFEWNWQRSGRVTGVLLIARDATAESLGFLTLQMSITTEPLGTSNDDENDVPWNQLQQQGRYYEFQGLGIDVEANVHPWTISLTNDAVNPFSIDLVMCFDFESKD
jgi:hypothetical protein